MARRVMRPIFMSLTRTKFLFILLGVLAFMVSIRQDWLISFSVSSSFRVFDSNVHIPPDSLYNAWERRNESCPEWIAIQARNNAYLDAYVVGSQKAGTTQLSQMLEQLGVRRKGMIKEWHFYNHLTAEGTVHFGRYEFEPFPSLANLTHLRLKHYQLGFPTMNETDLPSIDQSSLQERTAVIDSTVEYFHMERAAALSSLLTPHVRIVIMIRDPPARALSQYNMLVRIRNNRLRDEGVPDRPSSASEFDAKVRDEIRVLRDCGYDCTTATLTGNTTDLIHCMRKHRPRIDDVMYVLRGLYFLHIPPWREHFPDHRLLFVPFSDITRGYEHAYQRIARFLCVKPFTPVLIHSVESVGSDLSFGQRAVRDSLQKLGSDSYIGNDRYLPGMWPSTRKLLDDFYAPANKRLTEMLGRPMYTV